MAFLRITFKCSCDMQMKTSQLDCFKQSSKSDLIMLWNLIPVYILSPPSCPVGYSASLCQANHQFLSKHVLVDWNLGRMCFLKMRIRDISLSSFQLGLSCDPLFALKLLTLCHWVEISICSFTHSKRYSLSTCCMLRIAFSDVFCPES